MAKFKFAVPIDNGEVITARLGDSTTPATNPLADADVGKFVKLIGDSQYGLCAVGNEIEGVVSSLSTATQDGYAMGGVSSEGRVKVTLDGLQATPGTGVIAVGDYVVCGTVVARGTSLSNAPPKVCKATAAATGVVFKWRVVSLDGTTAVGQTGLIECVCC
jgi:hypothetical protein